MALVETRDLVKNYVMGEETVRAVDGVTLSIERGEYVAIMGASGSGKSTFMNMIGCLDVPTSGEVRIDGIATQDRDSDALAELRNQKIGFVFQQFNLLARTTALDNVAVPLIYAGLGSEERRARAKAKLEEMGLGDRLDHSPATSRPVRSIARHPKTSWRFSRRSMSRASPSSWSPTKPRSPTMQNGGSSPATARGSRTCRLPLAGRSAHDRQPR